MVRSTDDDEPGPERWGPLGGPAPQESVERAETLELTVTDGDREYEARLQPWNTGGAVYVAWRVGSERGYRGVLHRPTSRVLLGVRGYPEGDGEYRHAIELTDATTDALLSEVSDRRTATQSPSLGADPTNDDDSQSLVAPADAADAGPVRAFEYYGWETTDEIGYLQPWRPRNAGAVYVAFELGDRYDRYAVYDARTVRFETLRRVPYFFAHFREAEAEELEADVADVLDGADLRAFRVVE